MSDQPSPHSQPTASLPPNSAGGVPPTAPFQPFTGSPGERPGDRIGPYKLLEIIGEGGFGVVWLAERREPMVQRVALKVIKPGMDSAAVIARFEQERQALAVMDHPNVARVFDGGVTDSGRPYFVMEHVQGAPITRFADERKLTLRQRLELFVPVCEAVQHAHHKGLIHRDLKPSNVLVAEIEGKPVPKVIDFGVAKAIASSGWENTAHTQSGTVIGTPEYMSPEQVAGELDVDTRADVYSLGVLLYELLTGELPFNSAELRKAALAEVARIIKEVTPPKPSTRLAQLASNRTTTIAATRSATRERITSELRRELDWIPLMALRKERERRYASPQALADDVQRYLEGRPLCAAPDSKAYLARKFVRRHKAQVFTASVVFLALSAGLTISLWQRNEAIIARDAESQQRARADERADAATRAEAAATAARDAERERADQLKKVSDFQSQMLAQIDTTKAGIDLMADVRERFVAALEKSGVPEVDRTARVAALRQELLRVNATDSAAAMIDRTILRPAIKAIDVQFKDDPATDASLRQALADLYRTIGLYDAAFPLQESALATRRRVLGEEHLDTLTTIHSMGILLQSQGKLIDAEPCLREALDATRRVLGEENPNTIVALRSIGALLRLQGKLDQAEPYLRDAVEKSRRVLGEEHDDTLDAINSMGILLESQGKFDQAEPYLREALEMARRMLGEEHPTTLMSIYNVGDLLQMKGKLAEAEPYTREAVEKRRRVLGEEHPHTIMAINYLGHMLRAQNKLDEAEPYLRETLERSRGILGEEHLDTLRYINELGTLYQLQGKLDQAEPYFREALAKSRRVLGEEHPSTLAIVSNLGGLLNDQGKLEQAEPYFREALEKYRRVLGDDHPYTIISIYSLSNLLVGPVLLGSLGWPHLERSGIPLRQVDPESGKARRRGLCSRVVDADVASEEWSRRLGPLRPC
jgi:non-specific serine/threonine protein kinase/serine/threonine-protein kinase